jgi:hypothetical protein
VTAFDADPFELRQLQSVDGGLYLRADDVVACLRARAAQFGELAEGCDDPAQHGAYWAVSEAFAMHADQLDVAVIGCVTADPSPWVAGRDNQPKES